MISKKLAPVVIAASVVFSGAVSAEDASPFGYPATAIDAPATLSSPPAAFAQVGRVRLELAQTLFEDAARRWGAARLREGSGLFERDYACLAGTEHGEAVLLWLVSSDLKTVTEAQLERVAEESVPAHCRKLAASDLPLRLGVIGVNMSRQDLLEYVGKPSYEDGRGWMFWFSQRFLKNARGLQELELDWLGAQIENGRVVRAFASLVKNPS